MFDHVNPKPEIAPEVEPALGFVSENEVNSKELFEAKNNTLKVLAHMGVVDDEEVANISSDERDLARRAFARITGTDSEEKKREAVIALETPSGVAYVSTMLAQYDWQFVEQAANIRSFVVTKLIEESQAPRSSANARIKALELLGKINEVNLFSDRVQVTISSAPQEELEARLRQKLEMLETIDVEVKEIPDAG